MSGVSYSEWLKANPQVAQKFVPNMWGTDEDPVVVASAMPQQPVIAAPPPPAQAQTPEANPMDSASDAEVGQALRSGSSPERQADMARMTDEEIGRRERAGGAPPALEPANRLTHIETAGWTSERPDMSRPSRALAQIQAQRMASSDAIGASHIREGEVKAQAAESKAATIGAVNEKATKQADAAEANHVGNRTQMDKYKRYLDEDLEELRKPILQQNGYQRTVGIITGIVGAMGAQRGDQGGAGLAAGMAMLNQHANRNITQQLQERDSTSENFKRNQAAIATLAKDSSDEIDIANKLMANQYLIAENELKRIGETAKAPEYRENAFRLATGARDEADKYLEAIAMSKIRSGRVKGTDWDKIPTPVLQAAGNNLPLDGQRALELRLRKEGKEDLEAENTRSEIAKREQEKAAPAASADERKLARLLHGVAPAADTLRANLQTGAQVPHPYVKYAPDLLTSEDTLKTQASIASIRDILLRDESGAAIGEHEAKKKIDGWGIESGDPEIRQEGLRRMLFEYDTRLKSAGGGQAPNGSALPPDVQARLDALGIKKRGP